MAAPKDTIVTEDEYASVPADFYDAQAVSRNPLRRWFHSSRHCTIRNLVETYAAPGAVIADFGCGNCVWNSKGLPVIGVDCSRDMLEHARAAGRVSSYLVEDILSTSIPDRSLDILVITEVFEHLYDTTAALTELRRVLKAGGKMIMSVPYDTLVSMWRPLFKVQCLYRGYLLGEDYYRKECGHVNHFSPKILSDLLEASGFRVIRQFDNLRFTIFTVAERISDGEGRAAES